MTNKELQDRLKKYPDDMPVCVGQLDVDWYYQLADDDLCRQEIEQVFLHTYDSGDEVIVIEYEG